VSAIIPTQVRTARVAHPCDGYPHCGGIEPGELYEDWRLPPWRDVNSGPYWRKLKVHHPANGTDGGPNGCEIAAAYREHARREGAVATVSAVTR
jgi:hypothetical protein